MKKILLLLAILPFTLAGCLQNEKSTPKGSQESTVATSSFEKKSQKEIEESVVKKYESIDYDS